MKQFNTVQELWSYCLYCPICKDTCREIDISVSPDRYFKLISFKKQDNFLHIFCTSRQKKRDVYKINYHINCQNNKFAVDVFEIIETDPQEMNADTSLDEEEKFRLRERASRAYFYFYINSSCRKCGYTYTNSVDLETNAAEKTVFNIGVEREGIFVLLPNDKYHLTMSYDNGTTLINKCELDPYNNELRDVGKTFECPVINFDFSNLEKVVNKIKTIITFS